MRTSILHIAVNWLADADNAVPEERATVCELRVHLENDNVTSHLDAEQQYLDHVIVAAYPIAEGMAHNWWSLFGARDWIFHWRHHRMGYAIPDIRMRFDGTVFEISSEQREIINPGLRYWSGSPEICEREVAELVLSDFIEACADQLTLANITDSSLQMRWSRVQESVSNPDEAAFCEAAGALLEDPYQVSPDKVDLIERSSELFEGENLIELLSGIRGTNRGVEALNWVREIENHKNYRTKMSDLNEISSEVRQAIPRRPRERSWAFGYRCARATRRNLDVPSDKKFKSVKNLASEFGNKNFSATQSSVSGIQALISRDKKHDTHVHLRNRQANSAARAGQLFSLGRAIGSAICFGTETRSVVNDLHDAARQATSRAFAAEFLAPVDEILSMREDGHDNEAIAGEFGVSIDMIDRQLENSQRIQIACA